jgi:MFS family permease
VYISTVDFNTVMMTFEVTMPTETARGILTGCIPFGALFGALLGKKLIHVFSRRNYILFINTWALTAGSLLYVTKMPCFIIMRIIQGACIGIYTAIIPMTISEISPIEISGSTGAFTQIFCSIGTTSAYLFYYILSVTFSPERQEEIWYYVFGLPLITVSIQTVILLFVFPYETPKYFLLHHQKNQARDLIVQLYKPEYVDVILHEKIDDLSEALEKEKTQKEAKKALKISQNNQIVNTAGD